jgi:alpha-mannosidase II
LGSTALPSLSGDFFTYADRKDHYWSGYFTSRAFYKHLDRESEAALRAAEIIFAVATANHQSKLALRQTNSAVPPHSELFASSLQLLQAARQHLAVFQHHDGVTG